MAENMEEEMRAENKTSDEDSMSDDSDSSESDDNKEQDEAYIRELEKEVWCLEALLSVHWHPCIFLNSRSSESQF